MFTIEFDGDLEDPIKAASAALLKERLKGLNCPTHGPLEYSNSSNGYQVEVRICCDDFRKTVTDVVPTA